MATTFKTNPVVVVVDVEDEGDNGSYEAHVADGVGTTCHTTTLHILALLGLFLVLQNKKIRNAI